MSVSSEERREGAVVTVEDSPYKLVRKVSDGRFAEVWEAKDLAEPKPGEMAALEKDCTGCDLTVALKVATSDLGARMLRAEASLPEQLSGIRGIPHPIRFEDGERPVLVMPWLGERTLRDVLDSIKNEDQRAIALRQLLRVVQEVAAVHDRGWAHGDLKPENVILDETGFPYLLDFGLAREVREHRLTSALGDSMKTESGLGGGTLAYLPPEAVKGAEPSLAGDVYALGVMLHEVLLGRRPDKAVSPESLRKLLRDDVLEILLRALAYSPLDRFQDADELSVPLSQAARTLGETGINRRLRVVGRWVLAGLAAFFVALRYASVAVILASYASLALGIAVSVIGMRSPVPLIGLVGLLPILLLHGVIRWEGPETVEEANMRRSGGVVFQQTTISLGGERRVEITGDELNRLA